ncbi:relaxase domain-containing protein [uncultured Microbacterium sp.]|uniref:relaxase domain-containing protein n=1 Tax=uncultured Microbacterium sp. TaxID=191216 RepID=UPI0028EDA0AA|nr:relaxase domain-containing protein [uncultured Microbacterium sp.]
MRGGLERWKRGVGSQGVRQALAYAFQGSCDSHLRSTAGAEALAAYSAVGGGGVTRFVVEDGAVNADTLDEEQLRRWVDGRDPASGERRGRDLASPDADLILDGTINAPKSYSIAAMLNADLATEFESLQDRLRDRIITTWQSELNARRGAGGRIRESLRHYQDLPTSPRVEGCGGDHRGSHVRAPTAP